MNDFEDVRAAITFYAREYIRWCRSQNLSYADIGKRLNVSHSWVKQLDADEHDVRRIGPDVEYALAGLLHGGQIDAFRAAARYLADGGILHAEDSLSGMTIELPVRDSMVTPVAKRLRAK